MSNFRFLDDTDAQRQLGVDRLTFQELIRSKRLRPVSGQGTIQFFRVQDVAKLRDELNPESAAEDADATPAMAEGSAATPEGNQPSAMQNAPTPTKKKGHDPAMRVHLRLTADLKWYDIADSDLQAWFDQLHPDTYERRRANAQFVSERMAQIIALIEVGEARLQAAISEGD